MYKYIYVHIYIYIYIFMTSKISMYSISGEWCHF